MSDTTYRIWCLLEGENTLFSVLALPTISIDELKKLIKKEKAKGINVDADHLTLWKVDLPSPRKNERQVLTGQNVPSSVALEETDNISDHWPVTSPPNPKHLHIIVEVPSDPSLSHPVLISSPTSLRADTVSALYKRLNKHAFILVRGTPASGKTVLCMLLRQYIHHQEPGVHVMPIYGWPLKEVRENGGWENYLRYKRGWELGKKTVFIFDEAQLSYEDSNLWFEFFKNIRTYNGALAIAFASYGSPTSNATPRGSPTSSVNAGYGSPDSTSSRGITSTPYLLDDEQKVTLRQINHHDGLDPVGLLFSRMEFDDLVSKLYSSPDHHFHPSFFDAVFDLTGGHVGAIYDFVRIVMCDDSYRQLRRTSGQLYTWDLFQEKINLHGLLERLKKASVFMRGLPHDRDLQNPAIACIFSDVLREGSTTFEHGSTIGEEGQKEFRRCFRKGWLHADNVDEKVVYVFPSPLHRWYVEWRLWNTAPGIPFESNSILQLALEVIARFSPRLLSAERRIGPGCIQRLPEAQYQDEFYRSCHAYSNGSLVTFPEFGTGKGRVDFYLPSKHWGVELLREGDRLKEHSGRFSESGSYGTTLQLSDYIILDCRKTMPSYRHGIPKLYHVVFSNEYQDVSILDHLLQPIHGGQLRLLASA